MKSPVFYDASGRRKRWSMRTLLGLILLIVAAAALFAVTVVNVPVPPPLALSMERPQPQSLSQEVDDIGHQLRKRVNAIGKGLAAWLPSSASAAKNGGKNGHQIVVGFYVPWDDASRASLLRHAGQLDWLVPQIASVTGPDHKFTLFPDTRMDRIVGSMVKRPKILPMVQNALGGQWDGRGMALLLHDPVARKALLDRLEPMLRARKAAGVVFDFEEMPVSAQGDYRRFLGEARARLAPQHMMVTLAVPIDDPAWNLRAYARIADKLFLMDYDEHYIGGTPGPVASQSWFVNKLHRAVMQTGVDKAIAAVGNYAYDWTDRGGTEPLAIEEAWLIAHDSGAPIRFDRVSGNATFDYSQDGKTHHVWMLDAASAWNQLRAANMEGVSGVALWRLGTEDPASWKALGTFQQRGARAPVVPDISRLETIGDVDVEGNGEIIHIDHVPTTGSRKVTTSAGLVVGEVFRSLPTPYVVRRTGYKPGYIALTFDDGPDPEWTPKILDILKRENVSATFFVIGENAVSHPGLLRRIIAQGSEIGNHSYTHPNLALVSPSGTRIELNTTQRLVEAYTGRAMRLFRAPYFGDAEPTTTDELEPALFAQQRGYINIGLHVDPGDWTRPGVDAVVDRTIQQVLAGNEERSGQVILLHDAGGDRAQTVAALPRIIDGLRARGYHFVPVSQLAGLTPQQVNPPIAGSDLAAVRIDVGIFLVLAAILYCLKWLFFAAIALGIGRAVLMTLLAASSRLKRYRVTAPAVDPTQFVSVIIPAFNEAKVIEASVHRVLESRDVQIEVIVVDDGSTDATSAIVRAVFAGEPRVRLMTLPNGGKAAALNRALAQAKGDIIVALDADTQFEPDTIARLARWFADPEIGAVAGNAMVGNRINLVTRWQAVEYVTAQNLERRALTRFDAITVVPGAVGAWRRAALDDVGGYPVDTLAEDQDLTIAIQRKGWQVAYDSEAVAWTEAPESFRALSRQRFRWAFGTLQCLWKHRGILKDRRPAGLALIGLPQAWLFQIGFAIISPIIDLALVISIIGTIVRVQQHGWAQTQSDVLRMGVYWIAFTAIDVICGWVAYRLEPRERRYPALLLVAQRFIYRQIMYSVVIRAVGAALSGPWVGWGKLERSGRVDTPATPEQRHAGKVASG